MDEPITLTVDDLTALALGVGNAWVPRFADPSTRESAISELAQALQEAEEATAERDRLRAIVDDPDGAVAAMHARLDEAEHEQVLLVAERDRLRAVVEAVARPWPTWRQCGNCQRWTAHAGPAPAGNGAWCPACLSAFDVGKAAERQRLLQGLRDAWELGPEW